jgi:hypothetical protein
MILEEKHRIGNIGSELFFSFPCTRIEGNNVSSAVKKA